jgi:hypothetical protein
MVVLIICISMYRLLSEIHHVKIFEAEFLLCILFHPKIVMDIPPCAFR